MSLSELLRPLPGSLLRPPELGAYFLPNGALSPGGDAGDEVSTLQREHWTAIEAAYDRLDYGKPFVLGAGETLAQNQHCGEYEDCLFVLLWGEVQLDRVARGRAASSLLRAGAGTILNPDILHRHLKPRNVELPPVEMGRWRCRAVETSPFVRIDLRRLFDDLDAAHDLGRVRDAVIDRYRSIYAVHAYFEDIVASLRQVAALQRLSSSTFYRLLRSARYVASTAELHNRLAREWDDKPQVARRPHEKTTVRVLNPEGSVQCQQNAGLYVVTQGSLKVLHEAPDDDPEQPMATLGRLSPLEAFNSLDVEPSGPPSDATCAPTPERSKPWNLDQRGLRLAPDGDASFFQVRAEEVFGLLAQMESFRRRVLNTTTPFSPMWRWSAVFDASSSELVAFDLDSPHPGQDEEVLADAIAESLAAEMDRVLRVHVTTRSTAEAEWYDPRPRGPRKINERLFRLDCAVDSSVPDGELYAPNEAVVAYIEHLLLNAFQHYDYVLFTVSRKASAFRMGVLAYADTVVTTSQDRTHAAAEKQRREQSAASRARITPGPTGVQGPQLLGRILHVWLADDDRLAPPPPSDAGPALAGPVLWTRVRRRAGRGFYDADVDQLGRAISGRLVGVAAGGGGALAYSCIPVLEALHDQDVKVDVVSGNSGGSLVAAFYCAEEHNGRKHRGLEILRSRSFRRKMTTAALAATVSARAVPKLVNRYLRHSRRRPLRVQETPVRFLPFAVDADTLQPVVIEHATVGEGVAASGAAPVFYEPVYVGTNKQRQRFVDGVVVANVPVDFLLEAGCGVVVAVDPLPSSQDIDGDETNNVTWKKTLKTLENLGPLGRLVIRAYDGVRSGERLVSLSSQSSSSQADIRIKLPYGTLLRMPLFTLVDDVMESMIRQLRRIDFGPRVKALTDSLQAKPSRFDEPWINAAIELRRHRVEARHVHDIQTRRIPVPESPLTWPDHEAPSKRAH